MEAGGGPWRSRGPWQGSGRGCGPGVWMSAAPRAPGHPHCALPGRRAAEAWAAVTHWPRRPPCKREPPFLAGRRGFGRGIAAECGSREGAGVEAGGGGRGLHAPLSSQPWKADHKTVAAAAKETFSPGAARFQRPLPAPLAGSLSTFLQTGSPAVTGPQSARGLGESSAYGARARARAERPAPSHRPGRCSSGLRGFGSPLPAFADS
jgi:hypothetical protein